VETRFAIGRSYMENGKRRVGHGIMFSWESFKKVRKRIRRALHMGNESAEMDGMLMPTLFRGSSKKEGKERTQDEDVEMQLSMPTLWSSGKEIEPQYTERRQLTSTAPLTERNDVDSSIGPSVDPVSRLKGIFFPSFPSIYFGSSQ
jgi:hypothetical protein